MARKAVRMISSIALTFAKSFLSRYLVCPCNSQISLLYFLGQAALKAHRIFFHTTSSTYHRLLYILQDLVRPVVSHLSCGNSLLTGQSMICRVYWIPQRLIGIFQASLYWFSVLGW